MRQTALTIAASLFLLRRGFAPSSPPDMIFDRPQNDKFPSKSELAQAARRHCGKRETCEKHYLTSNFDSIHHDDKSCLYQQVTGNRPSFPKESFSCGIDSFPATFHYHLLKRRSLLKTGKRLSGQGERVTATVIQLKSHDCRAADGGRTVRPRPFVRRQFRSFRFTSFCRRAFKKAAALRVIPN